MNRAKLMIEYCRRDTEITGKFVKSMLEKYRDIGCEPKTTIAATTLNYFEKAFYGKKITHPFQEKDIDFFHEGYYGGRTEIFFNKPIEGKIWYHDLNSLYPFCLRNHDFPNLETFYRTRRPDFTLEGCCEVSLTCPKSLHIPYLPVKFNKKLLFPTGEFTGIYTYFEIREAVKLGYEVQKTHQAIEFPSTYRPFRAFIEEIYTQRLQAREIGDSLLSDVFKAFGNHAYGKYAQKNETTEIVPIHTLKKIPNGTVLLGQDLALIHRKIKYPKHANCIWASYTTAYARHRLYFHGLLKIKDPAVLIYCDTDSVIYESPTQILEDSKDLGKFKMEHCLNCKKPFRYAHFKLPKLYNLRCRCNHTTIYKAKGIPQAQAKNYLTKGKARFKKPNKLRETLRRNLSPNKTHKLIPNFWETREKETIGKYSKRIVLPTGFTIPVDLKKEK